MPADHETLPEDMVVSRTMLCRVLGISPPALGKHVAAGMPQHGRGRFHLPTCIAWRVKRAEAQAKRMARAERAGAQFKYNPDSPANKLREAQIEKLNMDFVRVRSQLIPWRLVEREFKNLLKLVSDRMATLPERVTPKVLGLSDVAAIQDELFRECREIRREIANDVRADTDRLREEGRQHPELHKATT